MEMFLILILSFADRGEVVHRFLGLKINNFVKIRSSKSKCNFYAIASPAYLETSINS